MFEAELKEFLAAGYVLVGRIGNLDGYELRARADDEVERIDNEGWVQPSRAYARGCSFAITDRAHRRSLSRRSLPRRRGGHPRRGRRRTLACLDVEGVLGERPSTHVSLIQFKASETPLPTLAACPAPPPCSAGARSAGAMSSAERRGTPHRLREIFS